MKKYKEPDFPEFAKDRDRIRYNTQRFAKKSITEAFAEAYDLKLSNNEVANDVPKDLRVGDVLSVSIINIEKNKVDFDTTNLKTNIMTSANLYRYDKFKHFLPKDPVNVRVTSITKDRVVVDPYGPMLDSWLIPIVNSPWIQKNLTNPQPIQVKNLRLTRGGFTGDAVIPNISNWVGEDYTIEAFIPGSQIVLNIADNFEDFVGKTVEAFVVNYIPKPGTDGQMSLICSRKDWIKFQGEQTMVELFKHWTEDDDEWKKFVEVSRIGRVTGIINSSKKCGVFIEIPELCITGMVQTKPEELVDYKPRDEVYVKLTGFEEEMYFNQQAQQMQHIDPYVITNGLLEKCNLKPILQFA